MASRSRRRPVVIVVIVAIVVVAIGLNVKRLWNSAKDHFASDTCSIGSYDLDTSQAAVAATMVAAVTRYTPKLPSHAAVLALAAGLQESKLRNLAPGAGDRDSVGVLQQRPSQGWGGGDPAVLQDVFKATTEFLDHLVEVPHWTRLPLAEAIQEVQNSADGSEYAKHEPEATQLANALLGTKPKPVSCSFRKPTQVAPAASVAHRLATELPVRSPTVTGTRITVAGAHWQTVAWLVSYADRLGIDSVAYDGQRWTRSKGWKASKSATAAAVVATMATLTK